VEQGVSAERGVDERQPGGLYGLGDGDAQLQSVILALRTDDGGIQQPLRLRRGLLSFRRLQLVG
jgi:hypothetical protein